jgi:hypothetical protein
MATPPPVWARELMKETLTLYAYPGPEPDLTWANSTKRQTTGRTWFYNPDWPITYDNPDTRIHVTAGKGKDSATAAMSHRKTLLHETAHVLVGPGHHHDNYFWAMAWELYRWQNLLPHALLTEPRYRANARPVYQAQLAAGWPLKPTGESIREIHISWLKNFAARQITTLARPTSTRY